MTTHEITFPVQVLDYLRPEHEYPHPVQDVPLWSENYLQQGYDARIGVGFQMHFARAPFDPRLWLENVIVYLPGNQFLVAHGYGDRSTPKGPGAVGLVWECTQPYREWKYCFDGAVRRVSGEELMNGPLADGMHTRARIELTCEAISHVFDLGDVEGTAWAKLHYEQHVRLRGTIECDGEIVEFDGTGLRDHSVGPRDFTKMGCHVWNSGQFPSGRAFSFSIIRGREGHKEIRHGAITTPDGVASGVLLNAPMIEQDTQALEPYVMEMEMADGQRHLITATVLQAFPFSLVGPNELSSGNNTGPDATHIVLECQARYEWDGEVDYGLTERSILRSHVAGPHWSFGRS